ncbi:MAG: DUF6448 family protein [Syntrophothermus sp.]
MKLTKVLFPAAAALFLFLIFSTPVYAHCDGVDGPVVTAAKKALETGNINYVLHWVKKADENMIKDAFNKTLKVRALSDDARELADNYFFETLVRIHRAGEGEPYTGLKPAGRDLGPVIPAADMAIEQGAFKPLKEVLVQKKINTSGLEKNFNDVVSKKNFDINNVDAGREYVESYVTFLHKAENMYEKKDQHGKKEIHENKNVHGNEDHAE